MAPVAAPFAERHAQVELCDRGAARVAAKASAQRTAFRGR
jgi:hypothetical protein